MKPSPPAPATAAASSGSTDRPPAGPGRSGLRACRARRASCRCGSVIESQARGPSAPARGANKSRVRATTSRRDCLQVSVAFVVNCGHMRVDVPRSAFAAAIAAVLVLAGCGSSGCSGDPAQHPSNPQLPARAKAAGAPKPVATAQGVVLTRDPEEDQSFPLPAGTRGAKEAPTPRLRSRRPAAQGVAVGDLARRAVGRRDPPRAQADGAGGQGLQARRARRRRRPRSAPRSARRPRADAHRRARRHRPHHRRRQRDREVPVRLGRRPRLVRRQRLRLLGVRELRARRRRACSTRRSSRAASRKWGSPGPGKWVTIYANDGHVFMYVAGLRFDTSGRDGPFGSRWQTAPRSLAGFDGPPPDGPVASALADRVSCRTRARAGRASAATARAARRAGRPRPGGCG